MKSAECRRRDRNERWAVGNAESLRAAETELQAEIDDWADGVFGDRVKTIATHLAREAAEIEAAPADLGEYADAYMLWLRFETALMRAAKAAGFARAELMSAARGKLEINKLREWGEPDAEGVREHVRGETHEHGRLHSPVRRASDVPR
jgi:hypothetical protein